MTGVTVWTLFT